MSCGTYCYHNRWVSQPGRLRKLSRVQIQPGPTRDYGSTGALCKLYQKTRYATKYSSEQRIY